MESFLPIFIILLTLLYAYQNLDFLIKKKDINILTTVNEMLFTPDDKFSYEDNGFNIAAGFTAYDGDPNPILDPTYGELVFNHYRWG